MLFSEGGQVGRLADDVGRQKDHQLGFGGGLDLAFEEIADNGNAAKQGHLAVLVGGLVEISPPMTTVRLLGVTTTVSAERLSMTGVLTVSEIATVRSLRAEISGVTIISTRPSLLMNGVTRRMMPMS